MLGGYAIRAWSARPIGNHSSVLIAAVASLKRHYSASWHAVADAVAWLP